MKSRWPESRLEKLINQYSEVFEEGLGPFTGPKAKIHVEVDAVPKFRKTRPVPYAMKGKIEEELSRLQEEGTIESVQFSEWAAPIVPIMKSDNSIRICGDYKTTVIKFRSWIIILYQRWRTCWQLLVVARSLRN